MAAYPELEPIGLGRAIQEVPSLAVSVAVSLAVLEIGVRHLVVISDVPEPVLRPLLYAGAVMLGLILFALGDFWDHAAFDPRYGAEPPGHWLSRTKRVWGLFPAGADLDNARRAWQQAGAQGAVAPSGYREAKRSIEHAGRWPEVDGPLALSKFARSFIWPALLVAALCSFRVGFATGNVALATAWSLAVLIAVALAWLSFIPYFRFRVEHMERVYRLATEITTGRVPPGRPPDSPSDVAKSEPRPDRGYAALLALLAAIAGFLLANQRASTDNSVSSGEHAELRRLLEERPINVAVDVQPIVGELRSLRNALERLPPACNPDTTCVRPSTVEGISPDGGATQVSGESSLRAAAIYLASGGALFIVVGLVIWLLAKDSAAAKGTGAALMTVGTLSLGGAALVKELKIDSVFRLSDVTLLKVVRQQLESLGPVGPERLGEIRGFKLGSPSEVDERYAAAVAPMINGIAEKWVQQRRAGKNGVLLIVGATDRVRLNTSNQGRFETNVGLARARAEYVRSRVVEAAKALSAPHVPEESQILVLVSGPRQTPERARPVSSEADDGFADDRRVDVWALWSTSRDSRPAAK
jgi:hypothetical protein